MSIVPRLPVNAHLEILLLVLLLFCTRSHIDSVVLDFVIEPEVWCNIWPDLDIKLCSWIGEKLYCQANEI